MGFFNRASKKTSDQAKPAQGGQAIAMIALSEAAWFDPALLAEEFARFAPKDPPLLHVSTEGVGLGFELGDLQAVVAQMPAPIPWTDLEGSCAINRLWPEATEQMKTHTVHYIVTVFGAASPLRLRVLLTRLVAAILKVQPCVGVYWGSGLVHSPERFLKASERVSEDSFDHTLWIDFRVVPGKRHGLTLFTSGMAEFGLMEIEAQNARCSHAEMLERVFGLATYLITKGPVINDGETMGLTATDKVGINHLPSMFPERGLVYQLRF